MTATPEQQMARIAVFAKLKAGVERAVEQYRDFTREELTTGQFAAQILLAIFNEGVAFYLDPVPEERP